MTQESLPNPGRPHASALTLRERALLLATGASASAEAPAEGADDLLDRWLAQNPFDDPAILRDRVGRDGLDLDSFRLLLATPAEALVPETADPGPRPDPPAPSGEPLPATRPLPGNARHLQRLLVLVAPQIRAGVASLNGALAELSREHTHLPFDPESVAGLFLPALEARLVMVLGRTAVLELQIARLQDRLTGDTPDQRFDSFVELLRDPAVADGILRAYPVLGRQVERVVDYWVGATAELLDRLCQDRSELGRILDWPTGGRRLRSVDGGQGDAHRRGRAVAVLTFDDGTRVVYKPRSLAAEDHYGRLLAWCQEHGFEPGFRLPRLLDRGSHGWMEFIAGAPCPDRSAVGRFYRRLGGHLALLHLLGAIDIHFENLIASGEEPVLVDLEPLLHPAWREDGADPLRSRTVLAVGLLPEQSFARQDRPGVDMSGIGAHAGQAMARPGLVLEHPGSDRMVFTLGHRELPAGSHRPRLAGSDVRVQDFAADLASGFADVYRLLLRHRHGLLAADGLLAAFADIETRVIVRNTLPYVQLLFDSYHPDQLGDALERDLLLDRVWSVVPRQPHLVPVVRAERQDLERGDVPYFTTRPDSRDLWTSDGERLPELLEATGLEALGRRFRSWGPADLERQLAIVRGSLHILALTADDLQPPSYGLPASAPRSTPGGFLDAARTVGDRLAELAFVDGDRATWMSLRSLGYHRWTVEPLGFDLFTGLSGISLFLAHLGQVTGEARYTELAERSWRQVEEMLRRDPSRLDAPGAFTGWGGVTYTRLGLAHLWRRPELLDGALGGGEPPPSWATADGYPDLLDGAAGGILAALRLHRRRPAAGALELARAWGDRLIAAARPAGAGHGWALDDSGTPPLAGLSHGAAGIAWALAELAGATGDDRYRDMARQGLAYERSLFSPEAGNWPDLRQRPLTDPGFMTAWCHGAPGIGLARLACLPHLDDPELDREVDAAVVDTRRHGFGKNHSLCHGDLGNLDFLLCASRARDDRRLAAEVSDLADRILAGIDQHGWLFGVLVPKAETPGLMVGLAGIGYQLLRLAAPERVPSVLSLEPPAGT